MKKTYQLGDVFNLVESLFFRVTTREITIGRKPKYTQEDAELVVKEYLILLTVIENVRVRYGLPKTERSKNYKTNIEENLKKTTNKYAKLRLETIEKVEQMFLEYIAYTYTELAPKNYNIGSQEELENLLEQLDVESREVKNISEDYSDIPVTRLVRNTINKYKDRIYVDEITDKETYIEGIEMYEGVVEVIKAHYSVV